MISEKITRNVLLLSVNIALTIAFVTSLLLGYPEYAGVSVGALAGWIGGNYNGRRESSE